MEDKDLTPCFAALCTCGDAIGIAVDEHKYAKENAKIVARWMREGFKIIKVTVDDVRSGRTNLCCCELRSKKKQKGLFE